jgi:tetratricopeptide (TPR) repeat protein
MIVDGETMHEQIESRLELIRRSPGSATALQSLAQLIGALEQLSPSLQERLDEIRSQLSTQERWETVVALIDLELDRTDERLRRATLLEQKGKVLQEEMLEEERALTAFEEALELVPENRQLSEALEHITLVRDNWRQIAERYVEEAQAATDKQLSTSMFLKAAEVVWRNAPSSDQVEQYLRRSLELEPRNRKASRHLERLYRQAGRREDLALLLDQRSTTAVSREDRLAALLSLGEIWNETARASEDEPSDGAKARAVEYYRQALALEASQPEAIDFIASELIELEDWSALARLYEDATREETASERNLGYLLQLAQLYEEKLERPADAEEQMRRLRKLAPANPALLDFYRRRYREERAKLLPVLEAAQRADLDPTRRLAIAREMAEIAQNDARSLDKAIDIWKAVVRLGQSEGTAERAGNEVVQEAISALKRLYRLTTPPKWNALRELIREQIDALPADRIDDKVELLLETIEIYRDHLKLDVMVVNTYNLILALKPDHRQSIEALAEHYEALGRWADLIDVLGRQEQLEQQVDKKIALLRRISELWLDKGNQSRAVEPLERILELDPHDERALVQLEDLYQKRRNWRALCDLWRHQADHASGARRIERLTQLAELATTRLGDLNQALEIWQRILQESPGRAEALGALSTLYARLERWDELAKVLRQRQQSEDDPDQSLRYLQELADLYQQRLGRTDRAIEVWQEVLSVRPEHPKALVMLRELLLREQRWGDLESFLAARGEYAELADALTTAADRCREESAKARLYERVGQICAEQLDSPERAIKSFERVIALEPNNVDALHALVPLYRATERWSRLLATYEALVKRTDARDERLGLMEQICRLCETHLGSRQMAFQWCVEAYDLAPERAGLEGELERLAEATGAWEDLVGSFRQRAQGVDDAAEKSRLLRRIAEIATQQLERLDLAEQAHLSRLELAPNDSVALAALTDIYLESEQWAKLAATYERRAAVERESAACAAMLLQSARLKEERLADLQGAIETYERLVALKAEHRGDALKALERLYAASTDWESLVGTLERELEAAADEPARVQLLLRLADVLGDELNEPERAVATLARAATIDPEHLSTRRALERYLEQGGPAQLAAARLLRPVYERGGADEQLALVLEVLLPSIAEDSADERELVLQRLVELHERSLENPERALERAIDLLASQPTDRELIRRIVALADQCDGHQQVFVALEAVLECSEAADCELLVRSELARLADDHLGRPGDAEQQLMRVIEIDPSQVDAWTRLERLLREDGRWSELRQLLNQRLDQSKDVGAQRRILEQICSLSEDVLEDLPAAISAYERILELQGDDADAVRALERLYRATETWDSLAMLYQRQLAFAPAAEERSDLLVKQATVRALSLQQHEDALELLAEVVDSRPEHEGAVSLLEKILERVKDPLRVLTLLEHSCERAERWTRLSELLVKRIDIERDVEQQRDIYLRLAELRRVELEDRMAAFETLSEAVAIAPADDQIAERLDGLIDELELWEEGVAAWKKGLANLDADARVARERILLRVAAIQLSQLGRDEEAAQSLEAVVALGLESAPTALHVTDTLATIYRRSSRWADLVRTLAARLPWLESSAEIQALHLEVAQVQEEQLDQLDQAIASYRALLAEDPESTRALAALERLLLRGECWPELVEVLEAQVGMASTPDERRQLRRRIADLRENALDQLEQTLPAHLAILDEFPEDRESLRTVARIYRDLERWPDLLSVLERLLELSDAASSESLELSYQIAELQHRRLDDEAAALERYRDVLTARPDHREARQALEELLGSENHRLRAAEILGARYEAEREWAALVRVLEVEAAGHEGAARLERLRRIVRLHEEQTGDLAAALDASRRALATATALGLVLEQLDELERLAAAAERWSEVADAIEAVLEQVDDEDEAQQLHHRAADICRDQLKQPERAVAHYNAVLEIEPDCMPALEALEMLHRAAERWIPLLAVLLRRIELAEQPGDQVPLLLDAAAVYRDRLGRGDDAIEQLERVRELEPLQAEALAELDALYQSAGQWQRLCALLQAQADASVEPSTRIALLERMASIRQRELADPNGAIEAWRDVLRSDAHNAAAREALQGYLREARLQQAVISVLEPIYVAQQQWDEVVRLYELRLQSAESAEQRLALSMRIAQLCEEQLEDLEQALQWYGRVFSDNPTDLRAREQVLRLGGILEQWEQVAELFDRYLATDPDESETVRDVALALGHIYGDKLYRWQAAQRCFQRILQRRPDDLDAFEALERLLIRYERWHELLGCYERAAERALDAQERRGLLHKIARVWQEKLEDLAQAIDVYRSILAEAEEDGEVVEALDRLYGMSGRWEDLCALLERQLGSAKSNEEQIAIKYRLGQIYEQQLGDLSAAIDYYEEVLRWQSDHAGAIQALERLVLDRDQRFRITQILAPIYEVADEWAKLVVVYEAELDFVDDVERRVHILREMGRLHEERGGALDLAFKALSRAFREERRREMGEEILTALERLAERMDGWRSMAELISGAAETVYDGEFRNALLGRLARLQEEKLADPRAAVGTWRRLLALREYDETAIAELVRLLEQLGEHGQLVEVLQRKAELAADVITRRECYRRVALLSEERLDDLSAAIDGWRQVLSLDEQDEEALDRLAALLEASEEWQELVWVYQQKVALHEDDEARWRGLQFAVVELYEQKLGGTFEAIALLKHVIDRIPTDTEAYDALERLYSSEGLWSDLLDLVELRESTEQDSQRRDELRCQAGLILLEKIGDVDAAIDRLERVVGANPQHEQARAALQQLIDDPGRKERVGPILERLYEKLDEPGALVKVLESTLDLATDAEARRAALVRIANLYEAKLEAPEQAFEAYKRALVEDPAHEVVQAHVERLSGQLGRWPETLELYETCLDRISEVGARRSTHLKLAQLYEAPVGQENSVRAEEHYRAALDLEGDDVETLTALESLLERQSRHVDLLDVLERLQFLAAEPAEQAQLSWRMGEIQRELGQPEAAFAAYRDALEREPSHGRARQAMMSYLEQEEFSSAGPRRARADLRSQRRGHRTGTATRAPALDPDGGSRAGRDTRANSSTSARITAAARRSARNAGPRVGRGAREPRVAPRVGEGSRGGR